PIPSADGYEEIGLASWYGDPFHGRKTANGETYDMYGGTAAHKTLPMGTMLLVKNLVNGKTATVRINDRGPFVDGRIIDLSYTTAKQLGIYHRGTEKVQIVALCAAEEEQKERKQKESYEDVIGALAEEDAGKIRDNIKNRKEQEEAGFPVLVAHSKKKQINQPTGPPVQVTGAQCAVIRPDGKKQRIRQDFDKGNFYIQVGSFEKKTRARKLARVFASQGHNVVIQEFAAAGTHLFRVLVFSSTSLKTAKKHKEKLKEQGYEHAFVIARENPPKKRTKATRKRSPRRAETKPISNTRLSSFFFLTELIGFFRGYPLYPV
ncbi:MAG: septal ring lytic transglycosylase RlpA family protein, partial [Candidatus Electrothrix sp. MAN1_4]|nr:septal ring lytic transglycosylase RlpA family protein [Candidatus Electrothrix sp. MAN1_4]